MQVTVAPNGQAAVDAYRREAFDVILMDVQMPVMSGYDATRAIRRIEETTGAHMPIVAMTARAMKGDRERCLEAGMDDYLSKPIQGKLVMEVIRRTLSPSPHSRLRRPATPLRSTRPLRWSSSAATRRRCGRSRISASPRRRRCSTRSSER